MIERHGAIWLDEPPGDAHLVYERYVEDAEKIHVVYRRPDGAFTPYSYRMAEDPQWRLPVWVPENDKSLLSSLEAAVDYLSHYGDQRAS